MRNKVIQSRLVLLAANVLVSLVLLSLMQTVSALNLKELCFSRCNINKSICIGSTLPGVPGVDNESNGYCRETCSDSYSDCDKACTASDTKCQRNCNATLSSCTQSCATKEAACNNTYSSCYQRCESKPQCTQDGHCGGKACVNGTCEAPCQSSAQCRQRFGPDSVCSAPIGHSAKRCLLI